MSAQIISTKRWLTQVSRLPLDYVESAIMGRRVRDQFDHLEMYVEFIGYPRSGHSLIAALLDAHPNMIWANELGALLYVHAGFSRHQILNLILRNSVASARSARAWEGYNFPVPQQWQGRSSQIHVVGDKQSEGTTLRLQARPFLLERLRQTMKVPVKFIHVIRHPLDNITTMFQRAPQPQCLMQVVNYYFQLCQDVRAIRAQVNEDDWLDIHHEAFVAAPSAWLVRLAHWMGQSAPADWVADCAAIVRRAPHCTRDQANWSDALRAQVAMRAAEFAWLRDYEFKV